MLMINSVLKIGFSTVYSSELRLDSCSLLMVQQLHFIDNVELGPCVVLSIIVLVRVGPFCRPECTNCCNQFWRHHRRAFSETG